MIDNAVRDLTHTSQDWNIYPLVIDSKEEDKYVILPRKGQKALQWDGNRLIVKPYDRCDEAQQWIRNGEVFVNKNKQCRAFQAVCYYCC